MSLSNKNNLINELLELRPKIHSDSRGFFSESFRSTWLNEHGFTRNLIQDNHSFSKPAKVLRGLHFQSGSMAQDKLVRCIRGRILDVAVDIRVGSPTFGHHVAVELSAEKWNQLLVPIGFAHGFVTLEPNCEVLYKTSNYYSPKHDKGLAWNDPALGIDWKLEGEKPTLSDKDTANPALKELPAYFGYKGQGYEYEILLEE